MSVDPLAADYASWSPYNYVLGNPILLTDPDGQAPVCETCKSFFKASVAYVAGAANAIASNFTGNAPGTRGNPADFNGYSEYAAAGQNAGDVLSVAIGTVEQVVGVVATVGGVIAAPETGGLSLTVSAAGTAAVAHGSTMSQAAMQNLLGGDGSVVQANENNQGSGTGRGKNKRTPDSEATGDHSVINDRGNSTFKTNERNPTGFDEVKRTDVQGAAHRNRDGTKVDTPHTHTKGNKDVRPAVKKQDY